METKDTITPSQYFDNLKNAKQNITTDALKDSYQVFLNLAEKYVKLGQTESLKKLNFLADVLVKEEKLIELGVTTFVYKDVIEEANKLITYKSSTKEITISKALEWVEDKDISDYETIKSALEAVLEK